VLNWLCHITLPCLLAFPDSCVFNTWSCDLGLLHDTWDVEVENTFNWFSFFHYFWSINIY
jgi:hypothetical protein